MCLLGSVQLKCDQSKDNNQSYAMKRIDKANLKDKKIEENTKLQKFILSTMVNPFITSLKFAFEDQIYIYLFMGCAIGGPVSSFLSFSSSSHDKNHRIQNFIRLGQQGIKLIVGSIVLAIQHLHNPKQCIEILNHNMLQFSKMATSNLQILDQLIYLRLMKNLTLRAGTVIYFAPEIALKQSYSKLVDF